jgi:hypothetical protein
LTNLVFDASKVADELKSNENIVNKLEEWLNGQQPALLGVKPEDPVYLYVFDQSTSINWQVVPVEWANPVVLQPAKEPNINNPKELKFKIEVNVKIGAVVKYTVQFPIQEIKVFIPNMSILEISNNYQRSGLVMAMRVRVVNDTGDESAPWLPFPVWLPPPLVGQFVWDEKQQQVTARFPGDDSSPLSSDQYSNYLGRKADRDNEADVDAKFGQVRWYGLDNFPRLDFLQSQQTSIPGGSSGGLKPCIPLPNIVAGKLAEMRRAGQWLYHEVTYWDDNRVEFNTPAQPGIAVIWRDDLPSKPIVCFDLLKYALGLAERLWRPVLGNGTLDLDIPIPVGDMIHLGVERLEDAANNELVKFIDNKKLTVKFAFLASDLQDDPNEPSKFDVANFRDMSLPCIGLTVPPGDFQDILEPGSTGVSKQTLGFHFAPQVAPNDLPEAKTGAFSLQLNIIIGGEATVLGHDLQISPTQLPIGPKLRFHPKPVKLPTMAIFFEDPYFFGTALVALPSGTGLFGEGEVHIDANFPDTLNLRRAAIVDELSRIKGLVDAIHVFWPDQVLGLVSDVVGEICALGRSVIDSTGKIQNASDCIIEKHWYGDSNFNDTISSVVLIGPPSHWTGTVINCWQNSLRRQDPGQCLRLKLPGDKFIAAVPDLRSLFNDFIPTMNLHAPPPWGSQPGDKPNIAGNNFDNTITGIEFVTEQI